MQYFSTRDRKCTASGPEAILLGQAPDGGLFVPESLPRIPFASWMEEDYPSLASRIFQVFFPEFGEEENRRIAQEAYGLRFPSQVPTPLHFYEEKKAFLELWHGPTLAFKDLALSALPGLMEASRRLLGIQERILILTATSGDTGKAAMEAFAGRKDFAVRVFYPKDGVSPAQRRQMLTQKEANVQAWALEGDFDACQRGVKRLLGDWTFQKDLGAKSYRLSSANSINIARLIPQLVYYIYAYLSFVRLGKIPYGEPLQVAVPSGNFGDFLAGYYAKRMGLPLGKMLVASNRNHVLADFGKTGIYDARRPLHLTQSPSMDILISSNLERFLYQESGSTAQVRSWMEERDREGHFQAPIPKEDLLWGWASEEACLSAIRQVYEDYSYVMDPHTAIAYAVSKEAHLEAPSLILSTASPHKFAPTVFRALGLAEVEPRSAADQSARVGESAAAAPQGEDGLKRSAEEADLERMEKLSGFFAPPLRKLYAQKPRSERFYLAEEMGEAILQSLEEEEG